MYRFLNKSFHNLHDIGLVYSMRLGFCIFYSILCTSVNSLLVYKLSQSKQKVIFNPLESTGKAFRVEKPLPSAINSLLYGHQEILGE